MESFDFWRQCEDFWSDTKWENSHLADGFVYGQKVELITLPQPIKDKVFAFAATDTKTRSYRS